MLLFNNFENFENFVYCIMNHVPMITIEENEDYNDYDANYKIHNTNENKEKNDDFSVESTLTDLMIPSISSKEFYDMKHKYRDDIMNITFYLLYDIEIDIPDNIKYYFNHYAQSCMYLLHKNTDVSSAIQSNDAYDFIADYIKSSMNTPTNSLISSNDDLNSIHSSSNSSRSSSDERLPL